MARNMSFYLVFVGFFDVAQAYHENDLFLRNLNHYHHSESSITLNERILSLSDMMIPGDRVSAMDRDSAVCSASYITDPEVAIQRTVIDFYYAIESIQKLNTGDPAGRSIVQDLEDTLFRAIRPAILWCYFDEPPFASRNLKGDSSFSLQAGGTETGDTLRSLSLDEARRLSIVSFSNSPEDEEKPIDCNFPTVSGAYCIVMHGMVTILHHTTSDVSLAVASIYDSTQKAMDNSKIFFRLDDNENLADLTNIEWLGETEQDAINGGPNGNDITAIGEPNEIVVEVSKQEGNEKSILAYALPIPLLILMALALLLAKKNVKRNMMIRDKVAAAKSFDNGQTGPYNCNETKQEDIDSDYDPSAHRKRFLVSPSEAALGVKHSSIDVHNCSSARCSSCMYKPREVKFISKPQDFEVLNSRESEV